MKAERARYGLTVKEVASRIGVSTNIVSRWEKGKADPSGQNLVTLANFYGVTPEYLLEQTDSRHGKVVAV